MLSVFFFYGAVGMLCLRLALGAILVVHGAKKARDLKGTAAWFGSIGFRPGAFWGTLAAILELVGGIGLAVGIATQLFAFLLAGQFAVIIGWKLRTQSPFAGGWEFDLLILASLAALFLAGPGAYSVDRVWPILGI